MTNIDDGGAAFPCANAYGYQGGMTLRDWFAGQALVAQNVDDFTAEACAGHAYKIADAMLAARNNNTENKENAQ